MTYYYTHVYSRLRAQVLHRQPKLGACFRWYCISWAHLNGGYERLYGEITRFSRVKWTFNAYYVSGNTLRAWAACGFSLSNALLHRSKPRDERWVNIARWWTPPESTWHVSSNTSSKGTNLQVNTGVTPKPSIRHRGNTYSTSLSLVSVHHHWRVNSVKSRYISPRVQVPFSSAQLMLSMH